MFVATLENFNCLKMSKYYFYKNIRPSTWYKLCLETNINI